VQRLMGGWATYRLWSRDTIWFRPELGGVDARMVGNPAGLAYFEERP
jgi:hypothetical protein